MRIGVLAGGDRKDLEWVSQLGFTSMGWMGFADGRCGLAREDWEEQADHIAADAQRRGIRISAIGALYRNPLDPKQTDYARRTFERAILVAARIGVRTVSGFPGAVIELEWNARGGNPVYRPLEKSLPQVLEFWEPLAAFAAERGIRIAFEHCPQGVFHLPVMHYNIFGQPAIWEQFFNETRAENIGIEWDPSHLICQEIDPVENIHRFGSRIFHVHAKDAYINRTLLARYGICHPGVAEHRLPGFGQAPWPEIIHALIRAGYDSDLNIEGRHDPVFRDHPPSGSEKPGPLDGRELENTGLLIAKRLLEQYTAGTE